jgi:alkylation response protein AidB-like acyl-CoA dehydrogenase
MLEGDAVKRLSGDGEQSTGADESREYEANGHFRVDEVRREFTRLVDAGALELPMPGGGDTAQRWAALREIAATDLCVARLAEAHLDALAILAELEGPNALRGSRWGVWAAHPPAPILEARYVDDEWTLNGVKPFCSGAEICTNALVTADGPDGYRLFAVDVRRGVRAIENTWPAVGMAGSQSLDVEFSDAPAVPVGEPGEYLTRPGFWHGALAVAACWHGGAIGLARSLVHEGEQRTLGAHALAHLGAIDATLSGLGDGFRVAAEEIDRDPKDSANVGEIRALELRANTERSVLEVLERVGRALGARPLCHDGRHATLAADLPVYVRQSHAEDDLARLGSAVLENGTSW